MAGFRSRPLRGISAEREPFSERLSRPKNSSVTPRRTTKNGTENMPPEDENVRVNVPPGRGDGASGSPAKMVAKSSRPPRPPRSAKRKLGLECQPESTASVPPDRTVNDTGVKVIIRMRPMKEDENEVTQIVQILPPNTVMVVDQQFTFDAVANIDSTQKDIFEMVGLPLVENCMEGFNSSIFAYGQTGSGKTYTMWGPTYDSSGDQFPNKDRGLTPRVFEQLFARIEEEEAKNIDKQLRYQCRCSFLEIYNEQITDLLEPSRRNLQIREDTKTGVYVENLTEEYVSSVADVKQLALRGLANRRVGTTSMNAESSRSHSVFTCVLESRCKCTSSGLSSLRTSRINLVDLAGSERQKLTGAVGERLKEAGNINRSLSQLGNLIKILAEVSQTGKQRHIPYRDSRLTFLLQESLGGNAKLAMVCAISPAASCRSETLSTLRFSQRAKAIQNKAVVNEETENDVNLLRDQIRQLKDELMRMKSKDNNQPTNNGGYSSGWNARRSYSLLRLSLGRPLTLPHTDTDSDEEMEIDEDAVEALSSDTAILSTIDEESTKDSRTSSSYEKEEIQNDLDGFNRENNSASAKIEPNNDLYPSRIDLAVESKEPTNELSLARDVNMEENQTGTNLSGQIQDVHFEVCETAEIQAVSKSSQQASKEISLFTPSMEHSESTKGGSGASDVKQLPQLAISEIHSSVQTDHRLLIDGIESPPHKSLSSCDLDMKDETSVTESLGNSCNDKTESACDASVSENGSLHNIPISLSPTLSIVPSPSSPILQSPPLSVSPRVQEGRRSVNKSLCKSTLSPPPNEDRNSGLGSEMNLSFAQSVRKSTHPLSNKSGNSRTDKLAASLQRGLQVFDIHQQNSALRKSSVRFSFQTLNLKTPSQLLDKVDKSVQTSPKNESSAATSLITELRSSCGRLDIIEANSFKDREDMEDKSQWQLMPLEKSRGSKGPRHELSQAVEGVLAGSIRREMALEEVCNKQATEIEHLNRLVRQYKHERECNSIIQQAREEKISRLEALVDGTISSEEYLKDELALLAFEHKLLEDKFQNHPEVTRAMIEEKRLSEELEKYRSFCELGERDALIEEIKNLRTQLQYYLDLNSSVSAKKLRLSVVNQSTQRPEFNKSAHSLGLCTISELPVAAPDETRDTLSDKKWEEENRQWTERENEWISLVDELRAELDSVNCLAEKRKQEVENEQRCSEELKEALQMAMEGHARILDQYAELQEKYMSLRAKHRKIREGVANARQAAVMAGIRGAALSLIESQAAELAAMKLDNEQECEALKDEIDGLQAQLRDTVEAVQAAGELVVRLKEAEEAVSIVQDAASRVDQDAEALRRDMQKLKRRHATEMATLNQRLLESRLQKSSVCPMCQVAERVKFEFPDADNATLEAASINSSEAQEEWREELQQQFLPEFQEHDELLRADQPSWFSGHDKCNI